MRAGNYYRERGKRTENDRKRTENDRKRTENDRKRTENSCAYDINSK